MLEVEEFKLNTLSWFPLYPTTPFCAGARACKKSALSFLCQDDDDDVELVVVLR